MENQMGYTAKVGGYNWRQDAVELRRLLTRQIDYLEQIEQSANDWSEVANNRMHQIEMYKGLRLVEEQLAMEER